MTPRARGALMFLITEDWYFLSHRLPTARAARDAGFPVIVATAVGDGAAAIEDEGFELHPLRWRRSQRGLVSVLRAVLETAQAYRRHRPAIVHHVALQAILIGGLAGRLAGLDRSVSTFTGLGTAFIATGWLSRLRRRLVIALLRAGLNRPGDHRAVVQNRDDMALLKSLGLAPGRLTLIPGSGVDIAHFQPLPAPNGDAVVFAYVGRLIRDKGLDALMEAARLLKPRLAFRLLLAGDRDEANVGGYPLETVRGWEAAGLCEWRGRVADVRTVWSEADVAVLPSRREGMPLSLLEAAACGRPMLAADAPGIRDLVEPFTNGLLHPVDDPQALAEAMAVLAVDADLRARLGAAAREKVERVYSAEAIGAASVALYRNVAGVVADAV